MVEATIVEFLRQPSLLHNFSQFDIIMMQYISGVKSGYGTRIAPPLPPLTRCRVSSKVRKIAERIPQFGDKQISKKGKEKVERDEKCNILQYCSRINALYHLKTSLECLKEKYSGFCEESYFNASINSCQEGVEEGSVSMASEIIYIDLKHVLCDSLYVGDVTSSEIEPFIKDLQSYIYIIDSMVDARVRGVVVATVIEFSVEGFLRVLLAGDPSRRFQREDHEKIENDFNALERLYQCLLPDDLKVKTTIIRVRRILRLFHSSTKFLIEDLKDEMQLANFSRTSTQFALPLSGGEWDSKDAYTILCVLCHRRDRKASDYLKGEFKLPKQL